MKHVSLVVAAMLIASGASTPVKADPWSFIAGVAVGAALAPAYGYPFGYRSGYAPFPATAPWALSPPPVCHWTKVWQNGAWFHTRVCDGVAVADVHDPRPPIVRK